MRLAEPFLLQFFGADRDCRVRMDGIMHRIWHRHGWLRPFFHLLAAGRIFFPEAGRDIRASMVISLDKEGVSWRRTFAFARLRRFDAVMSYEPATGLVERVGPAGLLEVPWRIARRAPGVIEISTGRLKLRLRHLRLPIPSLLQVSVAAVERAVGQRIEVELVLRHCWLGPVFGYEGTFDVRREVISQPAPEAAESRRLERYRGWFYGAAIYNLVWGIVAVAAPEFLFRLIGMSTPADVVMFQALGMMVLIYAPAYWWLARDPVAHRHLVAIAMLGKLLGPLGFLWAVAGRVLPPSFGLVILINDVLWWPVFLAFLRDAASLSGGWRELAAGR